MSFNGICIAISFTLVLSALLVDVFAYIKGPKISDRIWALDTLCVSSLGLVSLFAYKTTQYVYLDVVIALVLISFLATIVFARFIQWQAKQEQETVDD